MGYLSCMGNDTRTAICQECGAKCLPGQTHLEHNAGWKKKMLSWDWHEMLAINFPKYWPDGDIILNPDGVQHPPFVKLAICNKKDKSSTDIDREFDDIATGKFYSRDFSRNGSCCVGNHEWYDAGWWFQKLEDMFTFIKKYGGTTGRT